MSNVFKNLAKKKFTVDEKENKIAVFSLFEKDFDGKNISQYRIIDNGEAKVLIDVESIDSLKNEGKNIRFFYESEFIVTEVRIM